MYVCVYLYVWISTLDTVERGKYPLIYIQIPSDIHTYVYTHIHTYISMAWLRLVGSLKI